MVIVGEDWSGGEQEHKCEITFRNSLCEWGEQSGEGCVRDVYLQDFIDSQV
jgi:hypothetical protein